MQIKLPDFKLEKGNGWLYRLYLEAEIVYVGMTVLDHPLSRIVAHFANKEFDSFTAEQHKLEELAQVEMNEIKKIQPKYNIAGNKNNAGKQWIHPNRLEPSMPGPFKRSEAINYCTLSLKKSGITLNPKQRESLYLKLPRWVWVENGLYQRIDLDDFLLKIVSGKHRII